ncbi:nucleotide sugar dehydrogenase [Oceanobacillus caeni]|uniref:nucleotide sugar dehydrogenase n=1 Tax=Oceanobacillus caeni TaxID=405946 RepID=UPI0009F9389E|nr:MULTISPECIES: nucleotide sugar dehydrogenase [Bacillaceae]MED4476212.1 nucleotide sugar dehydrogenase [Oceanobacillus caeni]
MCVPTPLTDEHVPNLEYVRSAIDSSLPFINKGQLVIMESSTYPGMTEEEICPLLQSKGLKIGEDVYVAYSPERIDPGQKQFELQEIPKVVGGMTEKCSEFATHIYESIFHKVVTVSSTKVAEMCKLVENSQRLINISFMNELAMLCDKMNINLWEVIDAASTKPFGFTPYYPGPGIGGHCIPVDPLYLSWKAKAFSFDVEFIQLAHKINHNMPNYIVEKVEKHLSNKIKNSRILIVGAAYKKDVNDVRESAVLPIMEDLLKKGADVSYHDPYIPELEVAGKNLKSLSLSSKQIKEHDCALILTDYSNLPYEKIVQHSPLVIDTRNATKKINHSGNVKVLSHLNGQ